MSFLTVAQMEKLAALTDERIAQVMLRIMLAKNLEEARIAKINS